MVNPEWITAGIALVGSGAALTRYYRNSSAASAIRAADEMEKFYADEAVTTALQLIDWQGSYVFLKTNPDRAEMVRVDHQAFLLAARAHGKLRNEVPHYNEAEDSYAMARKQKGKEPYRGFSIEERRIREILDRFFNRLERIEALIRKNVIRQGDFRDHFSYWLDLMAEVPDRPRHLTEHKREALWTYIRAYEFHGVIRLFALYGKTRDPELDRRAGLARQGALASIGAAFQPRLR